MVPQFFYCTKSDVKGWRSEDRRYQCNVKFNFKGAGLKAAATKSKPGARNWARGNLLLLSRTGR
jgi:hypothetical protein